MQLLNRARGAIAPSLAVFILGCGGSDQSTFEPPGPASTISIYQGNNQVGAPGTRVLVQPAVKVTDENANPVFGVRVIFTVTSGGGSIGGEIQSTNGAGIATLTRWTLGSAVGTNTLTATATGLAGSPVTFTATADTTISPWDY